MPDNLSQHVEPALDSAIGEVLRHRPFLWATDLDGTVSEIARSPDQAVVLPGCRQYLGELSTQVERVAAISGRAATDASRLLGLPNVLYVGNHGLETLWQGQRRVHPEARRFVDALGEMVRALVETLRGTPGVWVEDKGLTASIHYREAIDILEAREAILRAVGRAVAGREARVTEGRLVVEIRPPVAANKGTAIRKLLDEWEITGAVFVGDDETDLDAFAALRAWRSPPERLALCLAVRSAEVPSRVAANADFTLPGVSAVENLLRRAAWLARAGSS